MGADRLLRGAGRDFFHQLVAVLLGFLLAGQLASFIEFPQQLGNLFGILGISRGLERTHQAIQDGGWRYPPFQDRGEFLPLLPRGLAAANEDVTPQSIDAMSEGAQLIEVAGDSMVLVVAGDNLPKPHTDLTGAIMLPALKLSLDGFQLRNHS